MAANHLLDSLISSHHSAPVRVISIWLPVNSKSTDPMFDPCLEHFQMLSPSFVKQIPVRSNLQLQLLSHIRQIWLPFDSKSTDLRSVHPSLLTAVHSSVFSSDCHCRYQNHDTVHVDILGFNEQPPQNFSMPTDVQLSARDYRSML